MRLLRFLLVLVLVAWLSAPLVGAADADDGKPDNPGDDRKVEKDKPPADEDDNGKDGKPDDDQQKDGDKDDPEEGGRDNPPIPSVEIKRININVYPHDVILIKGKMVEREDVGAYLKKLVDDARKDAVEVTLIPFSKEQMPEVAEIIKVARAVGYTRVSFISAKPKKKEITEVLILVSRSGVMVVNDAIVQPKALKGHLEKLVKPERREKVSVIVFAGAQSRKYVSKVVKTAREVGFKDILFGPIGD